MATNKTNTEALILRSLVEVESMEKKLKLLKFYGQFYEDEVKKIYQKGNYTQKSKWLNKKYLPSLVNNLTDYGVLKLIKKCQSINKDASYILLLSLFTGRALSKLCLEQYYNKDTNHKEHDIKFALDNNTKKLYFVYKFVLPKFNFDRRLTNFINKTQDYIRFYLPDFFLLYRNRVKSESIDQLEQEIKEIIEEVNAENTLRININQVSQYLSYWMMNNKIDSTIISIIKGDYRTTKDDKFKSRISGINYTQVPLKKITEIYYSYIEHLSHVASFDFDSDLSIIDDAYVGSALVINDDLVAKFFRTLSNTIQRIQINNLDNLIYQFNLYAIYTIQILNISTGHRPVNNPYEFIHHFNLDLKTLIIADKRKRNTNAERIIVLNDIAINQINNYLKYIDSIRNNMKFINSNISNHINKILIGGENLFGFMTTDKIVAITKSTFDDKMKNILPISLNWNRHYIRTTLCSMNIDGDLIDLWMGHDGISGNGLSEYSCLSVSDLEYIANEIQNIMIKLNIEPLKL